MTDQIVDGADSARDAVADVRLLGALLLASIGKGSRRQLLDAVMQWPPVSEMVERMAQD